QRVDYLAVAFADEGVELRKSGITAPILVMNPSGLDFQTIVDHHLEPEIYSLRMLKEWIGFLKKTTIHPWPVHIKIDTGMHRLGFVPDEADALIEILQSTKEINVKSVFTHLAATDMPQHDDFTAQQVSLFRHVNSRLTRVLKEKPLLHVLNSAGIERFHNYQFDMVRLGIGLYGVSVRDENLIRDISRLKTHISQIKNVKSTETVGYSRNGKVKKDSVIAILPIGYADGIHRQLGNGIGQFWLNGHRVKTVGNICMDMCMIDITGIEAQEGDEVVIFGPENPITRLAGQMDTIPYEILTSISSRVKKVYFHE
ncbi:MAG: alanine racemase, partial [Bacteroidetes bacterium]|nr:alanine racemase [Bacteroidota bacterium]